MAIKRCLSQCPVTTLNDFFFLFQFIKQKEWILQNYPKDTRYESIILTVQEGGNILTASTMQYLSELHRFRPCPNQKILTLKFTITGVPRFMLLMWGPKRKTAEAKTV